MLGNKEETVWEKRCNADGREKSLFLLLSPCASFFSDSLSSPSLPGTLYPLTGNRGTERGSGAERRIGEGRGREASLRPSARRVCVSDHRPLVLPESRGKEERERAFLEVAPLPPPPTEARQTTAAPPPPDRRRGKRRTCECEREEVLTSLLSPTFSPLANLSPSVASPAAEKEVGRRRRKRGGRITKPSRSRSPPF